MGKLIAILLAAALFLILFFPRAIPRLLRRLGRSLRTAGQVGREIATGEEAPDSPLARYEVAAGRMVLRKVLDTRRLSGDAEAGERVRMAGDRVAAGASRRGIPYRFHILDEAEPNAFAVPGGAIFITSALVDLCGPDADALAGVLAHEIAHIERRHAVLNLAARAAAWTGAGILRLRRLAILRQVAAGFEEVLVQGYRQEQEIEADRLGAELASRAGFDPRGFARLLRKLEERDPQSGSPLGEVFQYFRTHPPLAERIARLERRYGR